MKQTKFIAELIHVDGYAAPYSSHNTKQEAEGWVKNSPLLKLDCWMHRIYEKQVKK